MTKKILNKTIYLDASPERVWTFLTDPDRLAEWFHRPMTPLAEGNAFQMFGKENGDLVIWGKVITARPFEYLEHSFCVKPMGDVESLVKWTLAPVEGGTRLTLVHECLPQSADTMGIILALDKGWDEHFASLRSKISETVAA